MLSCHAFGEEAPDEHRAERVVTNPPGKANSVTKASDADGNVRLRAGNVSGELSSFMKRATRMRDKRDHGLTERDQLWGVTRGRRSGHGTEGRSEFTSMPARLDASPESPRATSHEPTPTAAQPCAMKSPALVESIPPTAMKRMWGKGSRRASSVGTPSTDAGNNLTAVAPPFHAATASEAVAAPGMRGTPEVRAKASSSWSVRGDTRNPASALIARRAVARSRTVPAPTVSSGGVDGQLDHAHPAGK
jgi:hypothetical protein